MGTGRNSRGFAAMAQTVDSQAVFSSRCAEIGLSQADVAALAAQGLTSFAKMAFACSYTPGSSDDTELIKLFTTILGAPPSVVQASLYRRLYFEAHTLAVEEFKYRVERPSDSAPRKLALAERSARHEAQVLRLTGVNIAGDLEPSHQLIDLVCAQAEDNCLRYVELHVCTRRDQEIHFVKQDPYIKFIDTGRGISGQKQNQQQSISVSSELLVRGAMVRRALAYDQCNLLDYHLSMRWIAKLFDAMTRQVPQGFSNPSLNHILLADRELFTMLADATRAGIVTSLALNRPLDVAIQVLFTSPDLAMYLMPVPSRGSSAPSSSPASTPAGSAQQIRVNKTEPKPKSKTKGKGKGKVKKADKCWRFQSPYGCTKAEPGGECDLGRHACRRCDGPHPTKSCTQPATKKD